MTSPPIALVEFDRPIDNTALADYMTCPRKFEYGMKRHRRVNRRVTLGRPPLSYGTAWHAAMEAHYKTNGDREEVVAAVTDKWEPHGQSDDHRTYQRVLLEYDNYCKMYGSPANETAKTVGWPENPLVEVQVNAIWPGALHPYAGKIDRVIEEGGQYYIEDHKTTSAMGDSYFKQFELDNQMMGYVFLGSLITGFPIVGFRVNGHAVLKASSKFKRATFSVSRPRLEDWAENYNHWIKRIRSSWSEGDFPMNQKACAGKYGMCQYLEICSLPPHLRDRALEQDFDEKMWNPLEHTTNEENE